MSHEYVTWAWKTRTGSPNRKTLLVAIADTANADGRAWPGQKRLAQQTEMGERTVREHLHALEQAGLIRRVPRYRGDGGRSSDYIDLPPIGPDGEIGRWPTDPPAKSAGTPRQDSPVPPGKRRRTPRQDSPDPPATVAGQEPPIEPSVEPSTPGGGEDAHARGKSNGDPRLLGHLTSLERRSLAMTRQDPDAEAVARPLAAHHPDLFRALHRVRERHRPDSITWCEWVKATGRALDKHDASTVAEAFQTLLVTPNVRSPIALIESILSRPAGRRPSRDRSGGGGDMEARMRERYPEAFQ